MSSKISACWQWFSATSTLIGIPVTLLLCVLFTQKVFFTATCYTLDWRCEYAVGATDAMVAYMGDLVQANPGRDIVSKPHGSK